MAKKRNRKGNRDHSPIATPRVVVRLVSAPRPRLSLNPLSLLEDRRFYHPEQDFAPARGFSSGANTLTARDPVKKNRVSQKYKFRPAQTKAVVAFQHPRAVAVCVRRKTRREVLFAKKRIRSGKGGSKRRNFFSEVSCSGR